MSKLVECTIAFLEDAGKVCLGMKKRGFGVNRWNGYGGKVGEGETVEESLCREIFEESGVKATSYQKSGEVLFHLDSGVKIKAHIYRVTEFDGEPQETEEMRPA